MKKANHSFPLPAAGKCLIAAGMFLPAAAAAAGTGAEAVKTPMGELISYWILIGSLVALTALTVSVLRSAMVSLRENGKEFQFAFPSVRDMAMGKGKFMSTLLFLLLLTGVIWALAF